MAVEFEKDEKKILEIRKHWIVIFYDVFISLVFAFIPFVILPILKFVPFSLNIDGNKIFLFIFFYGIWLLFVWISFFVMWTNYYLDVWIITDRRLIDIEQDGLFNREISALDLRNIQDVTSEVRGLIATFLKFGDVSVQTAAEEREFIIKSISQPDLIRIKLSEAHKKAKFFDAQMNMDMHNKDKID